jgi:hypothetical protein
MAWLNLRNIQPGYQSLGICSESSTMLRVYLKHEGHDGILVNGDARVANVNDGRAGGLANSEDIAGFTTAAKWINDGRASSQS